MPEKHNYHWILFRLFSFSLICLLFGPLTHAHEGIDTFYIRYDVKSSNNTIASDNLVMTPAKNDFRAENFSIISNTGAISATFQELKASIETRIRDNALKTILVSHGLKSVMTKDYDTIISYEGVIVTPLNILGYTYNKGENSFRYEVQIEFAPISFPDKWETLRLKHRIKGLFKEFFNLFK